MKATCIINNYNYGELLKEAIQSCLEQTRKFDEIIIVDDGSSDNSVEIIQKYIDAQRNIKLIAKSNAGQLSCFDIGFKASTGDIIFFLDADDTYAATYLETALNFYKENPACEFLFCGRKEFGLSDNRLRSHNKDTDYGYTLLLTYITHAWIGAPTSAISLRRSLLCKILPLPLWSDWITRADDCIIVGASLAGGRKRYMDKLLVNYRIQGNNYFAGRKFTFEQKYKNFLATDRMYQFFSKRYWLNSLMENYLYREFRAIPNPDYYQVRKYIEAGKKANITFLKKISNIMKIIYYFFRLKVKK